ncbi:MAG: Gfo/Idh/MocA family oxidoreductase [Planctomycetes bacterium]|nr:Gfo/Idh/MocA family oxidoreductase [Planctomycetota bacterium]
MASATVLLRVGVVGAGRTRQGLGPYLAAACEAAGARVVAVSGRDLDGARRAAAELQRSLGHAIDAAASAEALARQVDALVVAAPPVAHGPALAAALAADAALAAIVIATGLRRLLPPY